MALHMGTTLNAMIFGIFGSLEFLTTPNNSEADVSSVEKVKSLVSPILLRIKNEVHYNNTRYDG